MKIISTGAGPCPIAKLGDEPCKVEVESEWEQRPDVYLGAAGDVRIAGWRDVTREHVRYCITHRHVYHIPEREQWQ